MTEIPPPPRDDDPGHTADAAFYRSLVELGQRTAATQTPPPTPRRKRRRLAPRTALIASLGLLLTGTGGAIATKAFIAQNGSVNVEHDPGKGFTQSPADRRLGAAHAKDPNNPNTWGIRIYYNTRGETCALTGILNNGRLGRLIDGKFKALPQGTTGNCHNMHDHILITTRTYTDTPQPRTILYGTVDRTITKLQLHTPNQPTTNIPIAPDGTYLLPLTGHQPLTNATLTTNTTTHNLNTPTPPTHQHP